MIISIYILFSNYVLIIIIITPIITIVLVIISEKIISWNIGIWGSIVTFIFSVIMWGIYNPFNIDYQFSSYILGIDGISLYFVIITTIITPICLLSGYNTIYNNIKTYIILFLILETLLCLVFIVKDIILFYIFFESVLIPLFLITGIFGASGTLKIRASYLLFIYTLIGSLAILLSFVFIYYYTGTTNIELLSIYTINIDIQKILFIGVILSIAIKTPIIPFNTWLTFAHAEAPVGGSIILAGVILKLATYGYIRIVFIIFPDACYYYSPAILIFGSISVIYGSISTIRQTDFKRLIAYSSVAHIGLVVIGLFSGTVEGIQGAYILSLSHAFVSPALFYLVGGILYNRFHTRVIKYYKGLTVYIPVFSIIFFIFSISNAAVPLTGNWIGEFLSIVGIFYTNPVAGLFASISIVFSAVYSIWLYSRISFGSYSIYINKSIDINRLEFSIILPLLFFTVLIGIYPQFIINDISIIVVSIVYNV